MTLKNSRIRGGGGCNHGGSSGVTIQHVEIDGQDLSSDPGLHGSGFNASCLNIHNAGDDAVDIGDNSSLTDSYLHNPHWNPGDHTDGVQASDGDNMTISHNTILDTGTNMNEGTIIGADLGNISNVNINIIIDANNSALTLGNNPGHTATGISVSNNRLGRTAQYGLCNFNVPITFTNNVWDDTGAPLSC